MTIVLAILYCVIVVWLRYPKQTVGNPEIELVEIPIVKLQYQPTIEFIEIPIVKLVYQPTIVLVDVPVVQLVYKETTVDYSVLTVAQLRKIAQSYKIKGARSMRKAQLLESLSQH
jgi:hypothetical protein